MEMNKDRNWLKQMAAKEDGCYISVGGSLNPQSSDCPSCGLEAHPHQTCAEANMTDCEIRCALMSDAELLRRMDPVLGEYVAALREIERRLAKARS